MTTESDRILREARAYPALAIGPARAVEIAAELVDLERACAEAAAGIAGAGAEPSTEAFEDALRRLAR